MNETSKRNPLVRSLGSLKLTLVILGVFAVATATATFLEVRYGTEGARVMVYNARWFEVLMALLILNLSVSLFAHMPYRSFQTGYVITHIAFILVLISAGITRFFGYEGMMHIREGADTNYMMSSRDYVQISAGESDASFPVRFYKAGKNLAKRDVKLAEDRFEVTVEEYWPHYEHRLAEGPGGQPVFSFATPDGRGDLMIGKHFRHEGVEVHFLRTAPDEGEESRAVYGELIVGIGGETKSLAVTKNPPVETQLAGRTFRIIEFAPNFRVGAESAPTDPMNNPAIRVEITGPNNTTEKRLLFAFHPEFNMGHTGGENLFPDVALAYHYVRNLYVFPNEAGSLSARADFDLELASGSGHANTWAQSAGEQFDVPLGTMLRSGGFSLVPTEYWESATEQAVLSDDENRPAGARIAVADSEGNRANILVEAWGDARTIDLGERQLEVAFGPKRIDLPYRIHLDDFVLITYPGSENPASFESHVRVFDEERGVAGEPVRIYMNHPLGYRGNKHFQSSYDRDREGTVLSVNHDPGKWPTYFSYFLLCVGFLITLTRGLVWHRKPNNLGARAAMGSLGRVGLVLLIGVGLATTCGVGYALAQDAQNEGHHNHSHATPQKNFLSERAREALSRVMVQDFQGRMKPLDTLSRESSWKLTKRGSFDGWNPVDLYVSLMTHSEFWFEQPLIAVRNRGLKSMLGVPESTKHITPLSLYDASGQYRLAHDVEEAHRTPDKAKTKVQRKLISLDERFNLFHMTLRGLTLRIFPLPGDENNRWLAPDDLEKELQGEILDEYQAAFDDLANGLQEQDNNAVAIAAGALRALQKKYGAPVLPSEKALAAELRLNQLQPFVWASIPYLIAFGLLILAYAISLIRRPGVRFSFRSPLYAVGMLIFVGTLIFHIYGYILRWVAGGQAPLSNGYESLIFISVMIAVAGLFYEVRSRRASMAALSALLTSVILGVAMLPNFDAAISPLVPVLSSAWLIIHVTIITASYGYLGLASLVGMTMLVLYLFKREGRTNLRLAIFELNALQWKVLITGLAFLTVGTFLGGVWANESWGRYWGWDPKETWALVTILVYAFVVHMRFIPGLNSPLNMASGTFLSISSVGMTYFGVNYFLSGLHSYAQGDAPTVPGWVYVMAVIMITLVFAAYFVDSSRRWEEAEEIGRSRTPEPPKRAIDVPQPH